MVKLVLVSEFFCKSHSDIIPWKIFHGSGADIEELNAILPNEMLLTIKESVCCSKMGSVVPLVIQLSNVLRRLRYTQFCFIQLVSQTLKNK